MAEDDERDNVIVVPLRSFAFDWLIENNIYAYPTSSGRKILEFIAFYRPKPVGSITHYGEVKSIDNGDINMTYRAICFGDKVNEDAKTVKVSCIKELDNPVEGIGYGVQGWMYTDLKSLLSADTLQDL